jgi:hypothetical protein
MRQLDSSDLLSRAPGPPNVERLRALISMNSKLLLGNRAASAERLLRGFEASSPRDHLWVRIILSCARNTRTDSTISSPASRRRRSRDSAAAEHSIKTVSCSPIICRAISWSSFAASRLACHSLTAFRTPFPSARFVFGGRSNRHQADRTLRQLGYANSHGPGGAHARPH